MFIIYILFFITVNSQILNPTLTNIENKLELIIPFDLDSNKTLLADTIILKVNNENVKIGALTIIPKTIKEHELNVLKNKFAIITSLDILKNNLKKIKEISFTISYKLLDIDELQVKNFILDCPEECNQDIFKRTFNFFSLLLTQTNSYIIQLFLSLLLGLLMSFTPCIYPMIPITMGILQAQGNSFSIFKNAMLALSYTFGIAFTFAILGLTAALTGQLFGSIMENIFVLIILICWLSYMAFGMIGFYEIFLIKKATDNINFVKNKSFLNNLLTTFIFGALSGTVASPCLSPGLALLLTVVAAMANAIKGFFLLFSFGLGLGIPLTIIGTFSGSLKILPKAGSWMIEVKRLFGFLLLSLVFYFSFNFLQFSYWLITMVIVCLLVIIFLASKISKKDSKLLKLYKLLIIFSLATIPLIFFINNQKKETKKIIWFTDLKEAQAEAKIKEKPIILDFTTDYCSLCRYLETNLFENNLASDYLITNFIPTYINLSKNELLQKQFKIKGVPTIIICNQDLQEIKRFGSELVDFTPAQFLEALRKYEKI